MYEITVLRLTYVSVYSTHIDLLTPLLTRITITTTVTMHLLIRICVGYMCIVYIYMRILYRCVQYEVSSQPINRLVN